MFERLASLSVRYWGVVLALTIVFCAYAWNQFRNLPIEAFPDVTDPMVEVVGLYPGQAAEEVERRVTVELERVLAGTPKLIDLRSVSVFGLSLVTLTFEEGTTDFELRTMVSERLRDATLPDGASLVMGPQSTPVGQIYRYTLRGNKSLKELRAIQDFVVERRLRAVPGVAEVVTFGGFEKNYQIQIDPTRLAAFGVPIKAIHDALSHANDNAGGGYIGIGSQEYIVRGLGAIRDPAELGDTVIAVEENVPLRIRDVAEIIEGSTPRRGAVGRGHNDEVVEGIVLLRRGVNPSVVLEGVHHRVDQLNNEILPPGVQIVTFYDRTWLVDSTLHTVGKNLLEGALLVLAVVYCFLFSFRAVIIIAIVIPVSLLSAFVGLSWMGLPANLISLGAIDFGILVDGAIIVVEATLHALEKDPHTADRSTQIRRATSEVVRPVVFSMLIIIIALGPIFFLQRVEGRIFAPMAYTYAFALLGALVSAMVVVPALQSAVFRGNIRIAEPSWVGTVRHGYLFLLALIDRLRWVVLPLAIVGTVLLATFASTIGTEFVPELNEGGLYITSVFPSTIAVDQTRDQVHRIREMILETPEVKDVLSHIGRPEDATQAEGPNNAEFFVILAPEAEWREGYSRRDLETELRQRLHEIPGAQHNFSQPITDRVFETISGIIGQVVLKVKGADLNEMTQTAIAVKDKLSKVNGVTDLALYQAGEVPSLQIKLNRDALSRRGLSVDDVQSTIRVALGGEQATELWFGEQRFPVSLRLPDEVRANTDALGRFFVGDPDESVTLAEVAHIEQTQGRASIWREDFSRFVAVKFNVRGRDLGSTVQAAQAAIQKVKLPEGVRLTWGGEFQNQERAMLRLSLAVPVALGAILGLLYFDFRRWTPTLAIFLLLPIAVTGAVSGLRLMGENFSVSSAVGCIALLGQVVLSGVIVCTRYNQACKRTEERRAALLEGASIAFRPVLLTTMLAMLGLLPAAMSHAMGSETQRPFAIAIVAGLIISLPAVLFLLPVFYSAVAATPRKEVDDDVLSY
jgi:cobalt-zinc-cadmium resistance protein CzcA